MRNTIDYDSALLIRRRVIKIK